MTASEYPIAHCPGRLQFHRPQRGSQYNNSDYESHPGTRFLYFTDEHESWTCACPPIPKNQRSRMPARLMQLKLQAGKLRRQ